jgi:GNAT superfamily N-acetyltransferase
VALVTRGIAQVLQDGEEVASTLAGDLGRAVDPAQFMAELRAAGHAEIPHVAAPKTGEAPYAGLPRGREPDGALDRVTARLEGLGFQQLGTGANRRAFAYGDQVLKFDFYSGGESNVAEAAAYLRYPKIHPHVAAMTGVSDSGQFLTAQRILGVRSPAHPDVEKLFGDTDFSNTIAGKTIDLEAPIAWVPIAQARQEAAQLGGTARMKEQFSHVPGFAAALDEMEMGTREAVQAVSKPVVAAREVTASDDAAENMLEGLFSKVNDPEGATDEAMAVYHRRQRLQMLRPNELPPPSGPGVAQEVGNTLGAETLFVSRGEKGRAIGALSVDRWGEKGLPSGFNIAVDPDFRRQGVGSGLISHASKELGFDLETVSGATGYSKAGAAFAEGRAAKLAHPDPPPISSARRAHLERMTRPGFIDDPARLDPANFG